MSKRSPDHDPQLREALALADGDQLALLHSMNGNAAPAPAQLVPTASAKTARKPRRKRDYVHPEECPDVSEMLNDLASPAAAPFGARFGRNGWRSAFDIAAAAEAEIYNSWVILQCLKNGLREPGQLSDDAFIERFWAPDTSAEDSDVA